MPRGDEGGSYEEREHVEMARENVATPTGMEGAEQPLSKLALRQSRMHQPSRSFSIDE